MLIWSADRRYGRFQIGWLRECYASQNLSGVDFFYNGSSDPIRPDIKKDARGMAIKVLGVPGKKL